MAKFKAYVRDKDEIGGLTIEFADDSRKPISMYIGTHQGREHNIESGNILDIEVVLTKQKDKMQEACENLSRQLQFVVSESQGRKGTCFVPYFDPDVLREWLTELGLEVKEKSNGEV